MAAQGTSPGQWVIALVTVSLLGLAQTATADLTDYAVFGTVSVAAEGAGSAIHGSVGSNGPVSLSDGVKVFGNAGSGGGLTLYNSDPANDGKTAVNGNVVSGGHVFVGTGTTVTGSATAHGAVFIAGTLGVLPPLEWVTPSPFTAISLPTPATFVAGGDDVITTAELVETTLDPNKSYGDVLLYKNNILNLSSGNYFFDSFSAQDGLKLNLDLTGADAKIGIYVVGNVYTGSGLVTTLSPGGAAHDVYVQTNGNWNSLVDTEGNFYGTIYAPYGDVYIASNFQLTGGIYGNSVYLQDGLLLTADPVDFSRFAVPAPGALVQGAVGIAMVGWYAFRVRLRLPGGMRRLS